MEIHISCCCFCKLLSVIDRIALREATQKHSISNGDFRITLSSARTVIPILHIVLAYCDLVIVGINIGDLALERSFELIAIGAVHLDTLIQPVAVGVPTRHFIAKLPFQRVITNRCTRKKIMQSLVIAVHRSRAVRTDQQTVILQAFIGM